MRGLNSSVRGCLSKLLCVYIHAQCVIVGRSVIIIHTYLYAALCTIAALAKQNVFVCCLGVFYDLWKNTSLHATLEKKSTLLLCTVLCAYICKQVYKKILL